MMQHYYINGLFQYGAEALPGTLQVVNPAFRQLDKAVSKTRHQLRKLQAAMGASPTHMDETTIQKQAQTLMEIEAIKADLDELKGQRKSTARKVPLDSSCK